MSAKKVFISYRHVEPDQFLAKFLEHRLQTGGHSVFVDTHIKVGMEWAEEIESQIKGSQFFVVLLSEQSIKSDMVRREVEIAHHEKGRVSDPLKIFPVRVAFAEGGKRTVQRLNRGTI